MPLFNCSTIYQTRDGRRAIFIGMDEHFAHFKIKLTEADSWYRAMRYHDGRRYEGHDDPSDIIEVTPNDRELALIQEIGHSNMQQMVLLLRELMKRD
jgi:hypothetical protein